MSHMEKLANFLEGSPRVPYTPVQPVLYRHLLISETATDDLPIRGMRSEEPFKAEDRRGVSPWSVN